MKLSFVCNYIISSLRIPICCESACTNSFRFAPIYFYNKQFKCVLDKWYKVIVDWNSRWTNLTAHYQRKLSVGSPSLNFYPTELIVFVYNRLLCYRSFFPDVGIQNVFEEDFTCVYKYLLHKNDKYAGLDKAESFMPCKSIYLAHYKL